VAALGRIYVRLVRVQRRKCGSGDMVTRLELPDGWGSGWCSRRGTGPRVIDERQEAKGTGLVAQAQLAAALLQSTNRPRPFRKPLLEAWVFVHKRTMIISLLASSRLERPDLRRYEKIVHFFLRISLLSE
jgi:hypothetical protein